MNLDKESENPFSGEALKKFNERIDKIFEEIVQKDDSQLQNIRMVYFFRENNEIC